MKSVFVIAKRVTLTMDDLKNEDDTRYVEVPDDILKTKLSDVATLDLNTTVLVVEGKSAEGRWPLRKHALNFSQMQFETGDIIDAKDDQEKWYETWVRFVPKPGHDKFGTHIMVHWIGWNSKWVCVICVYIYSMCVQSIL